jgi:hypothetical protein
VQREIIVIGNQRGEEEIDLKKFTATLLRIAAQQHVDSQQAAQEPAEDDA